MSLIHYILAASMLIPGAAAAQNAVAEKITIYKAPASADATITMADIALMPQSGVADLGDGVYAMSLSLEISDQATFSIEGVKTLKMADGVVLELCAAANFDATASGTAPDARVTVTRLADGDRPGGIRMCNESGTPASFRNVDFEYVQLTNAGSTGFDVVHCTFSHACGALNSTGAIAVACTDAVFRIEGCTFTECEVPAIGCPANHALSLTIEDCTFTDNNTSNTNKPQLNLTVGGDHDLVVRNCTLTGTGRNMVGGIAVGNLTVMPGTNRVYIEGCTITSHRYGITGVGPMYMEIRDNRLIDNCHEANAMNGGSGISLAGYGYGLDAVISGNLIERSLWGVTLIQCRDVNLGQVGNPSSPGGNVFRDNANGGIPYDLYNNQSGDVYAQLNTWSVPEQTAEEIEKVIFHSHDNPKLGEVIFMPAASGSGIAAAATDAPIKLCGTSIISAAPACLYAADGTRLTQPAFVIDTAHLAPGLYIATDGRHTLKFRP